MSENTPKVLTISIAAYNSEKYLSKCLDSFVIDEVLGKLEVLVVNDGSTDKTAEIAEKYVKAYPDIFKLISKENGGHGSTINSGILNASGKYFKVVDSDDWVEKDGIIRLINYLENQDVDIAINTYYKVIDGKKSMVNTMSEAFQNYNQIINFDKICDNFDIAMHAVTFKTQILKDLDIKIDEHCFYVDVEYTLYPIKGVNTAVVFDYPIYDYLLGREDQSMNILNQQKRRDQHKLVCMSLLNYFKSIENTVSAEKAAFIKNRILKMIANQYAIYFSMTPVKAVKEEIKNFEREFKNCNAELFDYITRWGKNLGYIKLVRVFRSTGYSGYIFILTMLKIFRVIQ